MSEFSDNLPHCLISLYVKLRHKRGFVSNVSAKVRISENNTKQKSIFLFLLSSESFLDEVKDT